MSEGYITLFDNTPAEGNRPHYKGYLKIDGVEHEFALWPAKEGKRGFSGKYKPKEAREAQPEAKQEIVKPTSTHQLVFDDGSEIPF